MSSLLSFPRHRPVADDKFSRRSFLRYTAVAGAVSIVPRHVLGGAGQIAPSDKITLAGIGTGGQGMQNLEALQAFPEIQVVAVCDVNRESGRYLCGLSGIAR